MAVQVTLSYAEVLCAPARPPVRATLSYLEVLTLPFAPTRITLDYLEVLYAESTLPPPPPPVEVEYGTVTGVGTFVALDTPFVLASVVGSGSFTVTDEPLQLSTEAAFEAWASGDFEGGPGDGLLGDVDLSFETVVGVESHLAVAPPVLLYFATKVGVSGSATMDLPVQFATRVGVRAAHTLLFDGRRDLLGQKLYRR